MQEKTIDIKAAGITPNYNIISAEGIGGKVLIALKDENFGSIDFYEIKDKDIKYVGGTTPNELLEKPLSTLYLRIFDIKGEIRKVEVPSELETSVLKTKLELMRKRLSNLVNL